MNIILILIVIVLISIIYLLATNEPFDVSNSDNNNQDNQDDQDDNVIKTDKISLDIPKTYINPTKMITDDTLFNDTKLIRGDQTLTGELGLEKCIKKCDGMCVEYGVTGDAFCFPKSDSSIKNDVNIDKAKYTVTVPEKYSFKF